jgi:hypothetical protein
MAQKGVLWNGKYYVIPQAASRIDSSALARSPLGGNNKLVVLGDMIGLLPPKTATKISNPSLALTMLHPNSEEARLASQLVFDPAPGSEVQGASEVYLVPVNPATQAAKTFDSKLTLTSYMYGLPANQIKAKIEAGTTGKKVTVEYQGNTETFDNLKKDSFSVQYTGVGSAATLAIDVAAATHLLTTTVTGASDNLSLDLNVYTTIQSLVDAINATGKYTATILTGSPADPSIQLDNVTAQAIKASAYTCTSNLQAIIDGINKGSGYVSATRVTDAAAAPADAGWTYLTGGANGSATTDDWDQAFQLLKTMDIDLILPLTSDASIHAMADSHADYMSGPNGKSERRVFVGGALQNWTGEANRATALTALKNAAKALNSDRTMHTGLGSKHYGPDGKSKLYPGYITAAMYAGIAAGGSPVLPLTRKYLRCLGLEVELRVSEIEELLEGGIAVPIPDTVQGAGYVISRQVTTWNQDSDLYRIEFSVGRGADYIASEVRKRHELLIGEPGSEQMDATIINLTNSVLQEAKLAGYIRDYDPKQTQLRADNTIRYVDYSAQPILPINWIFSTYYLLPTTATIQL